MPVELPWIACVAEIALLLHAAGCGARSSLADGSLEQLDGGDRDAGVRLDAGVRDAGDRDAGDRDAGTCSQSCPTGHCLFYDGFEDGTGAWVLGPLWSESANAAEGAASLRGYWHDFDVGCSTTDSARMAIDVDLAGVQAATLTFQESGEECRSDAIAIIVSTDGGSSWSPAATPDKPTGAWTAQAVDLGPWLGQPAARFGFQFTNVCGDPCGVDWYVDDLLICATR